MANRLLIAIRGKKDCGKTTTIRRAYLLLKDLYPDAPIKFLDVSHTEVHVIMTIRSVKVGIKSKGDPSTRLQASLDWFIKNGCDIIICATRTRGETVDAVCQRQGQYEIRWFDKNHSTPEQRDIDNNALAQHIVNEVQLIINAG